LEIIILYTGHQETYRFLLPLTSQEVERRTRARIKASKQMRRYALSLFKAAPRPVLIANNKKGTIEERQKT